MQICIGVVESVTGVFCFEQVEACTVSIMERFIGIKEQAVVVVKSVLCICKIRKYKLDIFFSTFTIGTILL